MKTNNALFRDIYQLPYTKHRTTKLYDSCKGSIDMLQRMTLQQSMPVHRGCVNTLCWNSAGDCILSGSDDQRLVVTNCFTYEIVAEHKTSHRANIFSAKYLADNTDKNVVSCSGDGIILYTDMSRASEPQSNIFNCHYGTTYEIQTMPGEPYTFLSCGEDGTVRWFDLRVKTNCLKPDCKEDVMIACQGAVTALSVSPMRPYQLAIGCADSTVRIFDRRILGTRVSGGLIEEFSMRPLCSFSAPELGNTSYRITSLKFSSDGNDVLVSYSSDYLYLFSIKDLTDGPLPNNIPPQESTHKPYSRTMPPVKRLRLRGDWSDTGPNARPEREGGRRGEPIAQVRPTLQATLMQRMTDVLARMLNDPATRAALSGASDEPPPPDVNNPASPGSPGNNVPEHESESESEPEMEAMSGNEDQVIVHEEDEDADYSAVDSITLEADYSAAVMSTNAFSSNYSADDVDSITLEADYSAAGQANYSGADVNNAASEASYSGTDVNNRASEASLSGADVNEDSEASSSAAGVNNRASEASYSGADVNNEASGASYSGADANNQASEASYSGADVNNQASDASYSGADVNNQASEASYSGADAGIDNNAPQANNSATEEEDNNTFEALGPVMTDIRALDANYSAAVMNRALGYSTDNDSTILLPSNKDIPKPQFITSLQDRLNVMREGFIERHHYEPAVSLSFSEVGSSAGTISLGIGNELGRSSNGPSISQLSSLASTSSGEASGSQSGYQRAEVATASSSRVRRADAYVDSEDDDMEENAAGSTSNGAGPQSMGSSRTSHPIEDHMERAMAAIRGESKETFEEATSPKPIVKQKFTGHRNARTMIKEASFWGENFVMSGSDCGHVFIWERETGNLAMLLEADKHVVNCLQPHPYLPLLATSGIDYDIKLWSPLLPESSFDPAMAEVLTKRNEVMLEETRDTITVPASFMIRMLACLNQIRRGGGRARRARNQEGEEA